MSYLVHRCGLSLEKATAAAKVVDIKSRERADSVLELFESNGFTKTQVAVLISKKPILIVADANKLRPKIEYLKSLGLVETELRRLICANRRILASSLKNRIIPNFDFLRSLIKTDENLARTFKNASNVAVLNLQKLMVPNLSTLRAHGVPEDHIAKLLVIEPRSLLVRDDLFKQSVDEVREMGFQPTTLSFIFAVNYNPRRLGEEKVSF